MKRYTLDKEKYLLPHEYTRLHKRMETLSPHEPRNAALILTALYTGARASEILNIRTRDLDAKAQTVFIRGLKGSDNREVPIPPWLFTLLTQLTPKHGKIFPITYPRLAQIWESLGIPEKSFHSTRHTFALRLYKATKDIHLVKTALGHRNIANTMIYMEHATSTEEMRKVDCLWTA